jgi:hypothetical protein
MIAAGLTASTLVALSLTGCAKAVTGSPVAASAPTTHGSPTQGGSGGSGGSGGQGSTQGDKFCSTITPGMVQQAFGVAGAHVTTGQQQDTNGVLAVSCVVSASSASGVLAISIVAFDYSGQQGVTSQSALQNAQNQLSSTGAGTNFQAQTGVGDADGAFSYQIAATAGQPGFAVFAAKNRSGDVSAADIIAAGDGVQLSQVLKFAGLVDSN